MECPRCGASLAAYSLNEQTERVCEECGYVGLATTHTTPAKTEISESWDEVLDRFADRAARTDFESITHRSRDPPTPQEIEAEMDTENGEPTRSPTELTGHPRRIRRPTETTTDEE